MAKVFKVLIVFCLLIPLIIFGSIEAVINCWKGIRLPFDADLNF
jgi:hypothetical protein